MWRKNTSRGRGGKRRGRGPRKRSGHERGGCYDVPEEDATPSKRPRIDPHVSFAVTTSDLTEPGPSGEHHRYGLNRERSRRIIVVRDIDNPNPDKTQRDHEALDAWCHRSKPSDLREKLSVRRTDNTLEHADNFSSDLRQTLPPRGRGPLVGNFGRRSGCLGASNDDSTFPEDKAVPTTSHAAPQPRLDDTSVHGAQSTAQNLRIKLLGGREPKQSSSRIVAASSMTIQVFTHTPTPATAQEPAPDRQRARESRRKGRSSRRGEGNRELREDDDTNLAEESDSRDGRHDRSDRNLRKGHNTEFRELSFARKDGDERIREFRQHSSGREGKDDHSRQPREHISGREGKGDHSRQPREHSSGREGKDDHSRQPREHSSGREGKDDHSRQPREHSSGREGKGYHSRQPREHSSGREGKDDHSRQPREHSSGREGKDDHSKQPRKHRSGREGKDDHRRQPRGHSSGREGKDDHSRECRGSNSRELSNRRDNTHRGDRSQGPHFPANDRIGKALASGAPHREDMRRDADNRDRRRSSSHERERSSSRGRDYDSRRHSQGRDKNREQTAHGHTGIRQQTPPTCREKIREEMSSKKQKQSGKQTRNRNPRSRDRSTSNMHGAPESDCQYDEEPQQSRRTARGEINYKQFLGRIREDFTQLSVDAADGVCVFLAQNVGHVTDLTQDVHDRDTSDKLIELLRTAFIESENCVNIRSQIMEALTNSKFFESRLVNDLLKSLVPTRDRVPDEDDVRPMNHVLDILKVITRYRQMPHVDVTFFLNNLKGVLSQAAPAATVGASQVTSSAHAIMTLRDSVNTIEEYIQETERVKEPRDELEIPDRVPSTDMDLPAIIPKVTDIHGYRKVQFAPRKALDVFSTASEYVRYTFLVFRQDFIGPLCKAIRRYREYVRNADRHSRGKNQVRNNQLVTQRFKNQSVRLYDNVEVVDTALSSDTDVDVMIKIDPSRIKYFNSRLKFGSLVCLSDNDFESVIFATVKDKDVQQLKEEGLLTVHVVEQENGGLEAFGETLQGGSQFGREEEEMEEGEIGEDTARGARAGNRPRPRQRADDVRRHTPDIEALRGRTFTMLESTAFYTSYRHPLEALSVMHQKLAVRQSSLPFKKQLLELSKNLAAPRYLQASDGLMSFACMRKYVTASKIGNRRHDSTQGTVICVAVPGELEDTDTKGGKTTQGSFLCTTPIVGNMPTSQPKEKFREVNVQKPDTWPSAEELGLDNSQYAALQQALTKELALIQGPPGTGKTTIGVRIAEVLLENEHLWRMNEMLARTPLLLISYTNHALDQFLAELLALPVMRKSISDDVVRVGSRCENEEFTHHNLSSLRKTYYDGDGFGYQEAYKNEQKKLQDLRTNREHINLVIERYTEGIVHENTLRNKGAILEVHYQSLQSRQLRGGMATIVRWLKLHEKDCGERSEGTIQFVQRQTGSGQQDQSSSNSYTQQTQRDYRGDVTEHYGDGPGRVADVSHSRGDEDLELEESDTDEDEVDYYDTENEEDGNTLGNTNEQYTRAASPSDEGHSRSGSPFTSDYSSSEMAVRLSFLWSYQGQDFGGIPSDTCIAAMQKIQKEVVKNDIMSDVEESNITDIWQLDVTQRWRLYRLWLSKVTASFRKQRQKEEAEFQRVSDRVLEQRNLVDTRIMRRARIVAMTTTGASRMTSVLGSLGPRIVIVEEAAQVSEAHLLSSLSSRCEHLILIGDHQQLRPSYNDYSLTVHRGQHHVDISLFERLCRGGVPYRRLDLQHRMRPEISSLLVPTIYDRLTDHDDVKKYSHVRGVTSDIFFLDHQQLEDTPEDSKSKRNTHEASFIAALYRYLRLQGYGEKDITILATYKAQEGLLRKLIEKVETADPMIPRTHSFDPPSRSYRGKAPRLPKHHGARVTAVDNFQGEENKVILLSLVRSNKEGKIGFLREKNRVCVALSRAREGLFVIGNLSMLKENSPDCWKPILEVAQGKQQLGSALRLWCPRHKDQFTDVSCEDDFKQRCPNGGCSLKCDYRQQPCGHACDQMCHDSKFFHGDPCAKKCTRSCSYKHACAVDHPCWDHPCPPCREKFEMKMALCGHTMEIECRQRLTPPPCQVQCEKHLACGHRCQAHCGEECTARCQELVKVTSVCGHEFQIACWAAKDTDNCTVPCDKTLQCGHQCPGKCGQCFAGRLHQPCRKKCGRTLVCGHACKEDCTRSCPPCTQPCRGQCTHSKCREQCGDPCTPCAERCAWACKRICKNKYSCTTLCSELCNRPRCDSPCKAKHRCGECKRFYRCRGLLCEKKCPDACPQCNADIFTILFGNEDEPDARFYKMPDCGCVVELSFLDGWMDMANTEDEEGRPRAVLEKKCPKCKSHVWTSQRYGNVLKRAYADVMAVKTKLQVMSPPQSMATKKLALQQRIRNDAELRHFDRTVSSARTLDDLTTIENQLTFLRAILDLKNALQLQSLSTEGVSESPMTKASRHLDKLQKWTMLKRRYFSDQECEEFKQELTRADLTVLFAISVTTLKIKGQDGSDTLKQNKRWFLRLVDEKGVLLPEEETAMRKIVGVSAAERLMVVKAMGFQPGHWYKCPNGHVYAIGECGGAMQRSRCPECQADIGGSNHALSAGNAVATEMDGARHAAWSEQANLANYGNLQ